MIEALIVAVIIMTVSLAGVVFVWREIGVWMQKHLHYLITFAAGVFFVTAINLIAEAQELTSDPFLLFGGFVGGVLFLELGSRLIPSAHHHHGPGDGHKHSALDARRMLMGDAIHNIGDGLILVPAFIVSPAIGIATTVGIVLHEMVQEIAEFFVLKEAGYSNKKALLLNFAVSSTVLLGVVLSIYLSTITPLIPFLIAFAAGGFLYVVVRDLLPSSLRSIRNGETRHHVHIFAGLLGVILIFGIHALGGHSHGEAEDGHHHDHNHGGGHHLDF